jgi:hypothetical protein
VNSQTDGKSVYQNTGMECSRTFAANLPRISGAAFPNCTVLRMIFSIIPNGIGSILAGPAL